MGGIAQRIPVYTSAICTAQRIPVYTGAICTAQRIPASLVQQRLVGDDELAQPGVGRVGVV